MKEVKVRARIQIGSLTAETPQAGVTNIVLSFNVRRARGQISTFDARLKVLGAAPTSILGPIKIYAGENTANALIFTGLVRKASFNPCFDDPSYVILNVSGVDVISVLQGKKYSRRCRATKASWVTINSVSRKGLKSGKFKYKKEPIVVITDSELGEAVNVTHSSNLVSKSLFEGAASTSEKGTANGVTLEVSPIVDAGDGA